MSPNYIHEQALTSLRTWSGYAEIADAMRRFPSVRIYLAGGIVRNIVAGIAAHIKDFDFFIEGAEAHAFLAHLDRHGRLTYGPFGSPRWRAGDGDPVYCDIIRITHFNNGLWRCQDIVDVLNQFDFTANAIALDLRDGAVSDPQNGMRDARDHRLRAVRFDYPDEPISHFTTLSRNAVLWARLQHYAAVLHFDIEPVTQRWLDAHAHYAAELDEFAAVLFPPTIAGRHVHTSAR